MTGIFRDHEPVERPCVGSGYCCVKAQCAVSVAMHGVQPLGCPELEYNETERRHQCALMLRPGKEGERYQLLLHARAGCCSPLNSWRREPPRDRRRLELLP